MLHDQHQGDAIDKVRRLAASDPKSARALVNELLSNDPTTLDSLLHAASRPGDGRLRQVIATVYRTQPTAGPILSPWLRRWIEIESDEFTKNALALALGTVEARERPSPRVSAPNVVEAYRYVADRLCHRIRNALTLPSAQMCRLKDLAAETSDQALREELLSIHEGLQTGFHRIARNVEYDTDDGHLSWQSIVLIPWLERAASRFAARFGNSTFAVACDQVVRRAAIRATPFLLETLFGNIWANAVQVAESPSSIELRCAADQRLTRLDLLVIDAGPGFPESQLDTAFHDIFSTKAPSRGRGLLEIADAVMQLQGTVRLAKDEHDRYRIAVSLPLEMP